MTPQQRESLISRLRKLSAMTTARGCTEAEAGVAMQRLQMLMSEHNVTEAELHETKGTCSLVEFFHMSANANLQDWQDMGFSIGKLFKTKGWASSKAEDLLGLGFTTKYSAFKFFGFPEDIEAAKALLEICFHSLCCETTDWQAQRKRIKQPNGAKYLESFRAGFIQRICRRVEDMIPSSQSPSTGTTLVVLKNQLVKEEFTKLGIRMGKWRGEARVLDGGAFAQGQAAGQKTNLGQQSMPQQTKRIGVG